MKNQPAPLDPIKPSCATCFASELVRRTPSDIQKVLQCTLLPPATIYAPTQQGMMPVGAAFPIVTPEISCKQFRPKNLETESASPPKLTLDSDASKIAN